MHIGIDIRSLASPFRTGVGEYTFELLNAIFAIDKTNEYYLFANAAGKQLTFLPHWKQSNVHYCLTRYPNKFFNASIKLFNFPKIDQLLLRSPRNQQSPALQATSYKLQALDYFFSPNLNFTVLSRNVKHILTIHDVSFELFPHFFSLKQRLWHLGSNPKKSCLDAKTIITPSENTKRDLIDYYQIDPKKIKVIYHGLSSLFNPSNILPERALVQKKYNLPNKYLLFLSTIEPRKNILGLIEGFEQAARHFPEDLHLVIAGSRGWKNEAIFKRAIASPLHHRIKYIGYVEPLDKALLYQAAEIFVYPSFYEGFGLPIIEAMASGTAVITSNRSSLPEIAGSAAYFIDPNKPHTIAEGIVRILSNSEPKNRLIKDGLKQSALFTWQRSATEFLNLLHNSL